MNILFLALDVKLKDKTGDSIHVRELATAMAVLGNKVFLVTAQTDDRTHIAWAEEIPNLHLFFNRTGKRFRDISSVIQCIKFAKQAQAQIVYERRLSPKIGILVGKLMWIPSAFEINELAEEEAEVLGKGAQNTEVLYKLKKRFRSRLLKDTDLIVAVTKSIKDEIQTRYGISDDSIVVVPNGANTDLFKPMDQDTCKKVVGLTSNEKCICFTGNLTPWQGVRYMIDAMPLILNENPEVKFLVIGGGQQKESLEKRAQELGVLKEVIFTDWVGYEKVPIFVNASDICMAPLTIGREKSGSSAIKIYEYMACGKPVIASDVPNLEFLEKYGCGIVIPRDDIKALAAATIKLLQDPDLRSRLGIKAREIAVKEYSWANTAKKVIKLLEKEVH